MKMIVNFFTQIKRLVLPVFILMLVVKVSAIFIKQINGANTNYPSPNQIVNSCVKTYKESGLTGLKILSQKTYSELRESPKLQELEKAAIIDMFSYQLDKEMASYVGFPQDEYFSVVSFQERMGHYLKSMNLTNDEINKIVRKWEYDVNAEMKKLN